MIYMILGGALVLSAVAEVVGEVFFGMQAFPRSARPEWMGSGWVLVALGLGIRRWPRDWKVLTLFTATLLIELNQGLLPSLDWPRRLVVCGIGAYAMAYGWRQRVVDRGERKGLLFTGAWFAIVVGGGCILYALGWW